MYKVSKPKKTSLRKNTSYPGESIEQKVNRIVNNKEPIKDGAPLIYTDRKDGVKAEMNIRTDRFELALDAMDIVTKDKLTKRQERAEQRKAKTLGEQAKEGMKKEAGGIGGAEPTPSSGE